MAGSGDNRFVVPLKVRDVSKKATYVVYFVCDTGSPQTTFGKETADHLFGNVDYFTAVIQGLFIKEFYNYIGVSVFNIKLQKLFQDLRLVVCAPPK